VRRTTTIDMTWPGGLGTELLLRGRVRDLRTTRDGGDGEPAAEVLSVETMEVMVAADRTISTIETAPSWPEFQALVGARSGSGYRAALGETLPPGPMDEGLLRLLLDDLPGATLISGFAFAQWIAADQLLASVRSRSDGPGRKMEGVCTGFMPGFSGLAPDSSSRWVHPCADGPAS
jgi:hypothetical protein